MSDHFAPWWPGGQASNAWVYLGALGQVTTKPFGTGVTPVVHHYHPAVVAQAFMSLEELYPGRVWLGVGSGESLNEVPLGMDWPSVPEQQQRLERALEAINRLWDGESVTMDGGWFRLKEARLYTRARGRPRMYMSAFGPKAAAMAARHCDGVWTLGDPEQAPEIIDAYKSACGELGKEAGEVILQSGIAWAEDDRAALAGAKKWKPTALPEVYTEDIHDPAEMTRLADEKLSDEEFAAEGAIVAADPAQHLERLREMLQLGPTVLSLQVMGDADPLGTIRTYGEKVLPELRGR